MVCLAASLEYHSFGDDVMGEKVATAAEAWNLVHDCKIPPKQAAKRLGIGNHELYELLAAARTERDSIGHLVTVLHSARARTANNTSSAGEEDLQTKARRLLHQGLSTQAICERIGRSERWLASVRKASIVKLEAV